ncbi:MAG: hypothetical protein RBU30_19255 [Polyangia bacterium]|nr:hypothetical protein [Polyangia bacterium]
MEIVFALALLIGVFFVYLAWAHHKKQQAAWAAFARQEGLQYSGGSILVNPSMAGKISGLAVRVELEYRGSGNSRAPYTRFAASFRGPLPLGLKIARQGLGESLKIFIGGQDIETGIPELDPLVRIQSEDPEAAKAWVRRRGAGRHLMGFIAKNDEALLTQRSAQLVLKGFVTDPKSLKNALLQVTTFVTGVEEGAPWTPGEEPAFLPRPRIRAKVPGPRPEAPSAVARQGGAGPPDPALGAAADALVASLGAQGRVESEGRFTLNREKAKERMRELRLPRPELYVVSLLQAAVCKGARSVEVTLDSDDLLFRFDGRPFTIGDFEDLYGSMFAERRDRETRALQHLAMGVSAAVVEEPRFVELRSGDGLTGALLRLEPGVPDAVEPLGKPPLPTRTEIHVKLRLGERIGGQNVKVEAALRQAGCYARLELKVNGESVSTRFKPSGVYGFVPISWEGFEGFCAFDPDMKDRAEVRRLLDGAWISTETLKEGMPGFFAVLESERFQTDLSAGAIVQDWAWDESLSAVAEAEGRSLVALGQELERRRSISDLQGWAASVLRGAHLRYESLADFAPGGEAHELGQTVVWPSVSGGATSLWALMQACQRDGRLAFSHVTLPSLGRRTAPPGLTFAPDRALAVGWLGAHERAFFAHLFGNRLWSGAEELRGG